MKRRLAALAFSLLWGLSGVWARIDMPKTNVKVVKGNRVELKATYTTSGGSDLSASTVVWNFVSNTTKPIISYTKESTSVGEQFQGRVGFLNTMPSRDVSLYINNTQEHDSGLYLCQVLSTEGAPIGELRLDVQVPPAVPMCSMSGKPVLKGNVTLSCKSKTGKPIPEYQWKRTSPSSEVFFSPALNKQTGTLKLINLTSSMSGKYECTANNTAGSQSCFINLDIVSSNKVGVIVGATVGSVLGFIFLLLFCLAFLVFLKRGRYNEDDMANEIKEDAQAPKRVSWAKSGMGSDVISKNGTLSSIASSPRHREPPHHHHLQRYPQHPPSDTASIITATGSMAGYRPSRHHGASTPTHYSYNNASTLPRGAPASSQANGDSLPVQERYSQLPQAQTPPQQLQAAPPPPPLPSSSITASNISRMGGVPIMVPAQNQAGSLV
ncbi:endothelial cell adhesion molecule a [Cololabis saira]|uniref:endothelial cell adhesion molecule a n=1 Tax=Cololabis saira TaxID=129043 RepID=UPI002AD547DB|nr:endothelial cell adhesion molecule a [Cololabis saira]